MRNLIVTFDATPSQVAAMRSFCENKKDCKAIISVRYPLSENRTLSLSVFANRPEIYLGIFSSEENRIINDAQLSDEALIDALDALDLKFAHALTRESPVANKVLVLAWAAYIGTEHDDICIPLD